MTDEEKRTLLLEWKHERDVARETLGLARKKAKRLSAALVAANAALSGQGAWEHTKDGLMFGKASAHPILDSTYPAEADITDVLETIRDSEKVIQEYEDFVR